MMTFEDRKVLHSYSCVALKHYLHVAAQYTTAAEARQPEIIAAVSFDMAETMMAERAKRPGVATAVRAVEHKEAQ